MMTLKELSDALARRQLLEMRKNHRPLDVDELKEMSLLDNIRITSFSLDETTKDPLEKTGTRLLINHLE